MAGLSVAQRRSLGASPFLFGGDTALGQATRTLFAHSKDLLQQNLAKSAGHSSVSRIVHCSLDRFSNQFTGRDAPSFRKDRSFRSQRLSGLGGKPFKVKGPVFVAPSRKKPRRVVAAALTGPLVGSEAGTALWAVLAAAAALGQVLETRTKWGASVSAPLLTMGAAIALAWSGLIPTSAPTYELVWGKVMPLAVCLYLLETDVRKVFSDAGTTLKAFVIGTLGTILGTVVAFALVGRWMGTDGWKMAACLCASYIGGSINYAATAQALGLASGASLAAGIAADNLAMAAYFGVLMSWPTGEASASPKNGLIKADNVSELAEKASVLPGKASGLPGGASELQGEASGSRREASALKRKASAGFVGFDRSLVQGTLSSKRSNGSEDFEARGGESFNSTSGRGSVTEAKPVLGSAFDDVSTSGRGNGNGHFSSNENSASREQREYSQRRASNKNGRGGSNGNEGQKQTVGSLVGELASFGRDALEAEEGRDLESRDPALGSSFRNMDPLRGASEGAPRKTETLEVDYGVLRSGPLLESREREERGGANLEVEGEGGSNLEQRARPSAESVSLSLAAAAGSCCLGQASAGALPSAFAGTELALMAVIASLISVVVGHVTSGGKESGPHVAAFAGAETIGGALMQIFFAVVGATASLQEAVNGGWPLLVFILVLLTVHVAFIALLGSGVFKLPIRSVLIASNANVGGPATAAAMASAKGWPEMVRGALLTGTLGYTVGTAIGCLVGTLLRGM